jgi:diguanylate cyclase (GGDEF)-like protein/PAS domain S-box-containing protein
LITRIPIKYLLPLLLLAFSVTATTTIYLVDRSKLITAVELRMQKEAQDRLTSIQGTLELLLELNEPDGVARQLAAFSALSDNITLLITGANGVIIASNRQADKGQPLGSAHPEVDAPTAARVIERRSIETVLAPDGSWIDAYTSVCTRSGSTLRRDECGLLYHRLDLAYHQRNAQHPLQQQSRNTTIALSLSALLLGFLIHLLLFRRTELLATVVGRYARGERSVRSRLHGKDEIARLAANVDTMMAQIEADERELQAKEQHLKTLFDSVRDPIVVTSLDGTIGSFNRAAEQLFGYRGAEVHGKNINLLMPGRDRPAHVNHMGHYQAGQQKSTVIGKGRELTACNSRGEEFPVEVTITEMHNGDEVQLIGVIRDITERKRAEEGLQLSRQVFEAASEAIIITDADSTIIDVNPAYETITGYSRKEMLGQKPSRISSHRHDEAFYQAMWQRIRATGNWAGEIWDRRKSGEAFPKWLSINAIRSSQGKVSHYVGIFSDITEQKAAAEQLEHLAYYDPLTRLPNRALYRERLERELLQCQRNERHSALLFIDLDRFKQVNDTLGHDVGDDLLIAVAQRLTDCVRSSDTVARLGGDEFTVILSEISGPEAAAQVSQKIIEQLQQVFPLHGHPVQIGGSIGIALIPDDAADYIEINKKADIAMYRAKSAGRGNYQFFAAELT